MSKNTLLLCACLILSAAGGQAVGNASARTAAGPIYWTLQHPDLLPNGLRSIRFSDPERGDAVGDRGTILATSDAGLHWKTVPSPVGCNLKQVIFPQPSTGYIAGDSGTVLKSTDFGASWTVLKTGTTGNIVMLRFLDAQTGFALGVDGFVLKTGDGGLTWERVTVNVAERFVTLECVSADIWFVGSAHSRIYQTMDGGMTWSYMLLETESNLPGPTPTFPVTGLCFLDGKKGFAANPVGFYATLDGGLTWKSVPDIHGDFIERSAQGKIVSWDNSGIQAWSKEGGLTWTIRAPAGYGATSYHFLSDETVYATNENGRIDKSTDGGLTWTALNGDRRYPLTFTFTDAKTGYALAGSDTVLATRDAGITWTPLSNFGERPNDMHFTDAQTAYAVGDSGAIWKSTDAAKTWKRQTPKSSDIMIGCRFLNAEIGFAYALKDADTGHLFKTTDGGKTWRLMPLITPIFSMSVRSEKSVFAVTGNALQVSTDGGATWTSKALREGFGGVEVQFLDDSVGYVTGSSDTAQGFLKTKNAGGTWTYVPFKDYYHKMWFLNQDTAFAAGDGEAGTGTIFSTTDGWRTREAFDTRCGFVAWIYFLDRENIFVSGDNGMVWKYSRTAPTGIPLLRRDPPGARIYANRGSSRILRLGNRFWLLDVNGRLQPYLPSK